MTKEQEIDTTTSEDSEKWWDREVDDSDDSTITEYDITASPNDFNVKTIFDFIESGSVKIPGFQRNYVWDIKRASKLIESIIIGLPIPQIFLYEESKNKFLVIDGQQRMMSIYYFIKQRFPRIGKRTELRRVFDEKGEIPNDLLQDDDYFEKFNLTLPSKTPGQPNKLSHLNYSTLDEFKTTFDLRTIRNVIIKQISPTEDDSSVYEIFNRLNSGGVNLKPQEIRMSLYHSNFYTMLYRLNSNPRWRELLGVSEPDLHMKDIEILLRGFAMLLNGESYKPSMARFLNRFSKQARQFSPDSILLLENLFKSFLQASKALSPESFHGKAGKKFNLSMFEAIFTAACADAFKNQTLTVPEIDPAKVNSLKNDTLFINATQSRTADTSIVKARIQKAKNYLTPQGES